MDEPVGHDWVQDSFPNDFDATVWWTCTKCGWFVGSYQSKPERSQKKTVVTESGNYYLTCEELITARVTNA